MFYEYALISVVIASGYWGVFFLRRQPNGTPTFGLMQLGAAVLAGLGLLGTKYDERWLGIAGAIGLGASACMLVIGPLVRAAARRLASSERLGIASRLLDLAEILGPGSGVAEEKAVLGAMKDIRDGRVEETVDALTAARDRAGPEARLAIDERIALLYLAAYRWRDAIAHAEAHLFGAPGMAGTGEAETAEPAPGGARTAAAETEPRAILPDSTVPITEQDESDTKAHDDGELIAPAPDAPRSLRQSLGIAPPVWVELLGAYGRTGDLDRAARMVDRLENVCANREDAAVWVHRARLMFLALAGRPAAVRMLIDRRRASHMSVAARTYWIAVAHQQHGDRAAASAAYTKARGRSRGRPRELIDQALANLNNIEPTQLSPIASEVVARIEAAPLPAPVRLARAPQRPWATWGLTAVLVGVAATIATAAGPSSDPGVLIRCGAMVRGLIDSGEWWRLVTCVFVHVGAVHLVVNAIGMYFLGRVTEDMFGPARTVALFGVAGCAGAIASYLASPAGVSAGASGAVFGLLGAVFVELTVHRHKYRAAWKRGMWGGLVVVTIAQVGVGFLYPMIDQWAHGAGLLVGAVFGFALSPSARWSRVAIYAGRAIALMLAAFAASAAVLVVGTSIPDSLARGPLVRHVVGEVAVTGPASWRSDGGLADPDGIVIVTFHREQLTDLAPQMVAWIAKSKAFANAQGAKQVEVAPDRLVALPDGWEGSEQIAVLEDGMGNNQRYRLIVAGRAFGDVLIQLVILSPDSIARRAPAVFAQLITSTGPA